MRLSHTIFSALTSLKGNKVRTFLTMLGIIIGVFAVVALVSVVKGFENYIKGEFDKMGSNLLFISPGKFTGGGDPALMFTNNRLEVRHIKLIETEVGDKLTGITPYYEFYKNVKYGKNSYSATIEGTNEDTDLLSVDIENGRFFNKVEVDTKAKVGVIGKLIAKELFGSKNPIGEKVKIDTDSYTIIGTLIEKGANYDILLYVPYTTVKDSMGIKNISSIVMKIRDGENIEDVKQLVEIAMLRELKRDDFTVLTQAEIIKSIDNILNVISIGLSVIAGISLLVGGIGIMNIMLVSVAERTNEIGLRKALGATSFNISLQFMAEAVFISVIGGILGLGLSWVLTLAIQQWIKAEVTTWAVILALGFSFFVGVVFGTYPALTASKKDPIEALRYE